MVDSTAVKNSPEKPLIAMRKVENETDVAFAAFCAYRDAGLTRSIKNAADKIGKHISLLSRWANRHNWRNRADVYDNWCQDVQIYAVKETLEQMHHRHAQQARDVQELALEKLRKADPDSLDVREAVNALKTGIEQERLARGDATSRVEVKEAWQATDDILHAIVQRAAMAPQVSTEVPASFNGNGNGRQAKRDALQQG